MVHLNRTASNSAPGLRESAPLGRVPYRQDTNDGHRVVVEQQPTKPRVSWLSFTKGSRRTQVLLVVAPPTPNDCHLFLRIKTPPYGDDYCSLVARIDSSFNTKRPKRTPSVEENQGRKSLRWMATYRNPSILDRTSRRRLAMYKQYVLVAHTNPSLRKRGIHQASDDLSRRCRERGHHPLHTLGRYCFIETLSLRTSC